MFNEIVSFIKDLYPGKDFIPLHEPMFCGNEKKYLSDCIDSTFVSSVGEYVNRFEKEVCDYTGAKHAVATVNGTAALHAALVILDVLPGDEVIIPALTFIATANAVSYCHASPVFIDSGKMNLGLDAEKLEEFLNKNCELTNDGKCLNRITGKIIKTCIPMHVFGHQTQIDETIAICKRYNITVLEDAAEAMGSFANGNHLGLKGDLGILSFNGNKTITCGGGGMIITNNEKLAVMAKHITTTAKQPHPYEFIHDVIGYNYRLPNINAALACAQMEQLPAFIKNKRETASKYIDFFNGLDISVISEPEGTNSNYWLNAIQLKNESERDEFLKFTNDRGVMTRPLWRILPSLTMYSNCPSSDLTNAKYFEKHVVNIPSSVRL